MRAPWCQSAGWMEHDQQHHTGRDRVSSVLLLQIGEQIHEARSLTEVESNVARSYSQRGKGIGGSHWSAVFERRQCGVACGVPRAREGGGTEDAETRRRVAWESRRESSDHRIKGGFACRGRECFL